MTVSEDDSRGHARSRQPKVLVVDDLPANLKLVEDVLEPLECQVVLASSGRKALSLVERDEFAVLLLDVQMPEMNGYELAQQLRSDPKAAAVPIMFLTATSRDDRNVLRGYGSGAVDFLFKPVDARILRSKVQVFLDLYASQRRLAEAYAELKATQVQLIQSAKMASLGELVAGIAHEINNPLAFALSHLETVKRSLGKAEGELDISVSPVARAEWDRATARLQEIGFGLDRIRELVLKLRVFSRLDEGEWKAVSIRESVESVLMILQHRLVSGISVRTDFGTPDEIECYPSLLNQALLNVLANAIEALPATGTVTVQTGGTADAYEICIADTGPGIAPLLMDRVFEPFFTTKPPGQGTGLGLSITYSIMQKHGGMLALDCPPEGGTKVRLTLPIRRGPEFNGSGGKQLSS
ncbi:MAG TPA: response regulator [Polyangiaceae bacterium]|nr:response regulator [Polyangiaceae bacterium]